MRRTLLILAAIALVTMGTSAALSRKDTLHPLLAHQETLEIIASGIAAVSTALGGGEGQTPAFVTLTDQSLPANAQVVVPRQAGKRIIIVSMDFSAHEDTLLTFFDDATTLPHTLSVFAGSGRMWPKDPAGWLGCSDGNTLKVLSNGGSGSLLVNWVAR